MANNFQKALFLASPRGSFNIRSRAIPTPGSNDILVRIHSAALNPADWQIKTYGAVVPADKYPTVLGLDSAGEVVEVGKSVKEFSKGDRVLHQGEYASANSDLGTFQQYALIPSDMVAKVSRLRID